MYSDIHVACKHFYVEDFQSLSFYSNSISVMNINCQSLRNKFDEFELFLLSIPFTFDIICVTETWFFDDELQFFKLANYNFTGCQRDSRGGGVGAFVRCGLAVRL